MKVRPGIEIFAEAMEAKLKLNESKGGWGPDNCGIDYLEDMLDNKIQEYRDSLEDSKELVDIANFCMMLYTRYMDLSSEHLK